MIWMALFNPALAVDHEVYLAGHVDVQLDEHTVGIGSTVQIGYRARWRRVTLGAATALGAWTSPVAAFELETGVLLRAPEKRYRPWVGVEAIGRASRQGVLADVRPSDLRVAIRPFAWEIRGVTVSALELSYGEGWRDDGWEKGISANLVQLGVLL